MAYLERCLAIMTKLGDRSRQAITYASMGSVLLDQDGCEQKAIEMCQKACGMFEEGNAPEFLSTVFLKLGQAYRAIGAWDDAITSLQQSKSMAQSIENEPRQKKSLGDSNKALGQTYLDQCCTDESLVGNPERRGRIINHALFYSEAAFTLQRSEGVDPRLFLDLAQENYFDGNVNNANIMLKKYLDETVKMGPLQCLTCYQPSPKDAHMEKCSVCKVARYCSQDHSIQSWKKGRLCHKVMCPLFKRWRKMQLGKNNAESCDEILNDFFEGVLVSTCCEAYGRGQQS